MQNLINNLHEQTNFINPNISHVFNRDIREYDMKSAGISIIKELKLLPKETIDKLSRSDDSNWKHTMIGKMQRDDPKLKDGLSNGFAEMRKRFISANNLAIDDIISIKKDAFFVCKPCYNQQVGEHVLFREKHKYTSYIRIDKRIELYYSSFLENIDVKGISDDNIGKHKDYMLNLFTRYFNTMETKPKSIQPFIKTTIDKYKWREYDVEYYREFNNKSIYKINDETISESDEWSDKSTLDISYNFKILLKLALLTTI